jgi:uncharacterized protein YecE (DUF72 family)
MAQILTGTCSWTDPTLLATDFYPREANTPEKRLKYYADHFRLVEVDSTYYSLLAEKTARLWCERTPADFTFNVKAFSAFTQHPTKVRALPRDARSLLTEEQQQRSNVYYRDLPDEAKEMLWQRFAEALLPLDSAGKLGVVLFQFPQWFFPGRDSKEHILTCQERLAQYRLAIEFRNAAWMREGTRRDTLEFLKNNKLIYVCVDEPQGFKSSVPAVAEATSDIALARFHGRNKDTWEKKGISVAERFKYLYSRQELGEWVPRIAHLASKTRQVHVLFNNCYGDYGVRNARDMDALIRAQAPLFPELVERSEAAEGK